VLPKAKEELTMSDDTRNVVGELCAVADLKNSVMTLLTFLERIKNVSTFVHNGQAQMRMLAHLESIAAEGNILLTQLDKLRVCAMLDGNRIASDAACRLDIEIAVRRLVALADSSYERIGGLSKRHLAESNFRNFFVEARFLLVDYTLAAMHPLNVYEVALLKLAGDDGELERGDE